MTPDAPADRRRGGTLAIAAIVAGIVAGNAGTYLLIGRRLAGVEARLDALAGAAADVERAVQLFRMERGSKGLGVEAILDQLAFWAPLLASGTTPAHELPRVRQHVADALAALEGIGKDAYPALERAFRGLDSGKDDELRQQIFKAMVAIDAERGMQLLEQCVRAWEVSASSGLRVAAARELAALDPQRAGKILIEILGYDSAAGVQMHRLTPDQQQRYLASAPAQRRMPLFFTFVDILADTGVADAEPTMVMVAGRQEHDLPTIQTCVKRLGEARSRIALKQIEKLFDAPPEMQVNPIFQNHCLDAIAKIAGPDACDFFKDALRRGYDPRVEAKLKELIKQTCS